MIIVEVGLYIEVVFLIRIFGWCFSGVRRRLREVCSE